MMKFNMLTKSLGLAFALALMVPAFATAQEFSSAGIIANTGKNIGSACADGAMRAQERALTIQRRISRILTCNRAGQLYDPGSGGCVDPLLSPEFRFTENDSSGDTLAFRNPNGTWGADVRIGGRRGDSITCIAGNASCMFNGVEIEHGDTVVAYLESTVPFGDNCNSITNREVRTCNDGELSGSFTNDTCNGDGDDDGGGGGDGDPTNCQFNGELVLHGAGVTAYQTPTAAAPATCQSEVRYCTDGVLSGTYQHPSCEEDLPTTPEPPTTDCFFWVSGYVPGAAVVGKEDNLSNHVGRGAYPDATIPFAKANSGTFDSIAIGPKTRLVIYKQKNYQGGEFVNIHGPVFIGNRCLVPAYERDWKTDTTPLVTNTVMRDGNFKVSHQKYSNMFPPMTRIERVMNHTSAGCEQLTPDPNAADKVLLWGGGSVKVYCDR